MPITFILKLLASQTHFIMSLKLGEPIKESKNLKIRNLLNGLFILLSIIAMIGIGVTLNDPEIPVWCYGIAIVAVVIKMIEATMRMSGSTKVRRRSRFDKTNV